MAISQLLIAIGQLIQINNNCYRLSSIFAIDFLLIIAQCAAYCIVPENIHTPPTEGIGNSWGVGVLKDQKF